MRADRIDEVHSSARCSTSVWFLRRQRLAMFSSERWRLVASIPTSSYCTTSVDDGAVPPLACDDIKL